MGIPGGEADQVRTPANLPRSQRDLRETPLRCSPEWNVMPRRPALWIAGANVIVSSLWQNASVCPSRAPDLRLTGYRTRCPAGRAA
jgi:hypothetical protein